jgi:hypothetical protein
MKFLSTLALGLPLAQAMPAVMPIGSREITDPVVLQHLRQRHDLVLEGLRRGEGQAIGPGNSTGLEERFPIFAGIAGLLLLNAADFITADLTRLFKQLFYKSDTVWEDTDRCRVWFTTKGGGNCQVNTYDRGATDPSTEEETSNRYVSSAGVESADFLLTVDTAAAGTTLQVLHRLSSGMSTITSANLAYNGPQPIVSHGLTLVHPIPAHARQRVCATHDL